MLEARKAGAWRNRYEISARGLEPVIWDGSFWRTGGTFELDGQRYAVRGNAWGNRYTMLDQSGSPVASADRVGRKNWTVEAGGCTYSFRRASAWRVEEHLLSEGR